MKRDIGRLLVHTGALILMLAIGLAQAQTPPIPIRGVNGPVFAIAIDSAGNVYVGGYFTQAGDIYANNIAMWNPTTRAWSRLEPLPAWQGNGVSGQVNSIAIGGDGKVYVGGKFNSIAGGSLNAHNVGVWDPVNQIWGDLAGGVFDLVQTPSSKVESVFWDGGILYVAGNFERAGGSPVIHGSSIPVDRIAKIELTTLQWSAMGNPPVPPLLPIECVKRRNGVTYISGRDGVFFFTSTGSWQTLDPNNSVSGTVEDFLFRDSSSDYHWIGGFFSLTTYLNSLGGLANFYTACGISGGQLICNHYHPIGFSNSSVDQIAHLGDSVIAVGSFSFSIQDQPYDTARNVIRLHETFNLNGTVTSRSWSVLGLGAENGVNGPAFATGVGSNPTNSNEGLVYVGGQFSEAGSGICAENIAVWDSVNNTWSALIENAAPTVSISTPANGSVFSSPASVTIHATASDDCAVSKVDFYQDGNLLGTDETAPYSFNWAETQTGTYILTAKATDNEGAETLSDVVLVHVSCMPPTVSIDTPLNGALYQPPATITINASAADSDGSITMVEFFHGNTLLGTDTTAPFSFTWSGVSAGVYQITAKATDNDGCYAISEPIVIRVDAFLINVDFGAGTGPSTKSGLAGTGQAANDFWNFYTRDDGNGGWLSFGSLPNLKLASGDITSVGMTVDNAPGYWGSGSSDPMYNGYIYPFGGNATITVTDLPVGRYDLYLYGVDTTFQVSAGGVSYGTKTSYDSPVVNPPIWQEGKQFALFKSVAITSPGQTIVISVQPGQAGWAVVSGLQIAPGIRL